MSENAIAELATDLDAYEATKANMKDSWGEQEYNLLIECWKMKLVELKEQVHQISGVDMHYVDIAHKCLDTIEKDTDKTEDEREIAKAVVAIALFELDPKLFEAIRGDAKGGDTL